MLIAKVAVTKLLYTNSILKLFKEQEHNLISLVPATTTKTNASAQCSFYPHQLHMGNAFIPRKLMPQTNYTGPSMVSKESTIHEGCISQTLPQKAVTAFRQL